MRMKVPNKNGFLLLEVMLSVIIVLVGVVFIAGAFRTAVLAAKRSRAYLSGLYRLEERMWPLEEKGAIEPGSDSGSFEKAEGAEWETEAEEMEESPLLETKVTVRWKEGEQDNGISVHTYLENEEDISL